jgi:hypothetical protein
MLSLMAMFVLVVMHATSMWNITTTPYIVEIA